jgi:hypothetical protein
MLTFTAYRDSVRIFFASGFFVNHLPPSLFSKISEIFAIKGAPAVSRTPAANLPLKPLVSLMLAANLLLVSTTLAANVPLVSMTPVAICHQNQRHRRQICHRCQRLLAP